MTSSCCPLWPRTTRVSKIHFSPLSLSLSFSLSLHLFLSKSKTVCIKNIVKIRYLILRERSLSTNIEARIFLTDNREKLAQFMLIFFQISDTHCISLAITGKGRHGWVKFTLAQSYKNFKGLIYAYLYRAGKQKKAPCWLFKIEPWLY